MTTLTISRPLFSLNCDDSLIDAGEHIANVVSNFERKSPGLVDGVTVQIGWSLLKLIQHGSKLVLCEPDYSNNPFTSYREDISATLWSLSSQMDFISDLGCEPLGFRFDDKVLIKKDCLGSDKLFANRSQPTEGDSGWYIGPDERKQGVKDSPKVDELEAIYAYQLLNIKPHLLDVMMLPVGWIVIWDNLQIVGVINDKNETVFFNQIS